MIFLKSVIRPSHFKNQQHKCSKTAIHISVYDQSRMIKSSVKEVFKLIHVPQLISFTQEKKAHGHQHFLNVQFINTNNQLFM